MTIPISLTAADDDRARAIERPDGFYWQDKFTDELYGPFPTLLEAVQDMQSIDGWADPEETVEDVQPQPGDESIPLV